MVLQNNSSDSESSDSDDDRLAQLREAADNDLINDDMFQLDGKKFQDDGKDSSKSAGVKKSQRFIADDNNHIDDLLIPEEVQKFVSKKLTKIIESRVEFVDILKNENLNDQAKHQAKQDQIKLLDDVVLNIDWNNSGIEPHSKRKRPEIRKRIISDIGNSKPDSIRLKEAVIEVEDISKEVSNWSTKPKGITFEYRQKNGKLFEIQPKTEFSVKRQKNNWDESKITRNKKCFT